MPAQFSWVDHRLVRDRHLDHLDVYAAALYLLLVTVADAQGLSWYGDVSTARRLSIDEHRLRQARGDLISAGLLAYARPFYQVLALDSSLPPPVPVVPRNKEIKAQSAPALGHAGVQQHIAALHAALGRCA